MRSERVFASSTLLVHSRCRIERPLMTQRHASSYKRHRLEFACIQQACQLLVWAIQFGADIHADFSGIDYYEAGTLKAVTGTGHLTPPTAAEFLFCADPGTLGSDS